MGVSRGGAMTPDARPDTRMVTDADAAEWGEWGKDDPHYWGSEPIVRLLADRERLWRFVSALSRTRCDCVAHEEARRLLKLKEAHGE